MADGIGPAVGYRQALDAAVDRRVAPKVRGDDAVRVGDAFDAEVGVDVAMQLIHRTVRILVTRRRSPGPLIRRRVGQGSLAPATVRRLSAVRQDARIEIGEKQNSIAPEDPKPKRA